MYSPEHYREKDADKIFALIRDNPFATLLAPSGMVSHLPLILHEGQLLGHMARANPQWKEFLQAGRARALFHGPHAYISPAWYKPRADNVPTWSYAVAHVEGTFAILEGAEAAAVMDFLIAEFETKYGEGWRLPRERSAVEGLMKAITVFKISELDFNGKFKLNQKQDAEERGRVVEELRKSGVSEAVKLAQMISEI